ASISESLLLVVIMGGIVNFLCMKAKTGLHCCNPVLKCGRCGTRLYWLTICYYWF
ncbi:MAG: hypothetical protein ACI9LM_005294, partial [Alteromonadaceae bacterium]